MKRRWTFTFRAVTSTILNGIISAYVNTFTGNLSFTHYTTNVYTVTAPQSRPPAKVTTVNAVVNRYDVSISLEQV